MTIGKSGVQNWLEIIGGVVLLAVIVVTMIFYFKLMIWLPK